MSGWSDSAAVSALAQKGKDGVPFDPIRAGNLVARVAFGEADIDAAQALRYRVFYEEMKARPSPEVAARRRDFDVFDPFCDHLLVIDAAKAGASAVVGTYRVMRRAAAARKGGFYSQSEYDIKPLLDLPGEVLELGRSCVDAEYRTRSTMNLLWRSIAAYVFHYEIEVMFGCASLAGTDVDAHAAALSYLHHHHLAPPALRPRALPDRYVDMRRVALDRLDPRTALASLPPLVKGYLRLGGFVGDGAVIDPEFNTTDVSIVVKTDLITEKYVRHYERPVRESPG
ncbi:MAG: GNAT family N-acetyltransferase [Gemmatimonas sp.]